MNFLDYWNGVWGFFGIVICLFVVVYVAVTITNWVDDVNKKLGIGKKGE